MSDLFTLVGAFAAGFLCCWALRAFKCIALEGEAFATGYERGYEQGHKAACPECKGD